MQAVAKVTRIRETVDKTSSETAYYLLSQPLPAERLIQSLGAHWGAENSLHWCLDVVMEEDCARNHLDHGLQNLAVRHRALNLMRNDPRKASLRGKFKIAAWNNNYLVSLLSQF
jgi:predicted transposase YbfD/YdcC